MDAQDEALRTLGLTEYEARAYAALVALGPAAASEAAAAARVPRTKVYAVLAGLVRKGWIEREGGRPATYRPLPPRECFERERARLGGVLDAALPALEAQYRDRSTRFAGPLWMIRGMDAVGERTLEMVGRAREDVLLFAGFPLAIDERELPRAVRAALKRGVRARIVVPSPDAPHARALAASGAELRMLPLPPRVVFVDGAQVMTAFPFASADGRLDCKALWNPSPEFGDVVGEGLRHMWGLAEPLAPPPVVGGVPKKSRGR